MPFTGKTAVLSYSHKQKKCAGLFQTSTLPICRFLEDYFLKKSFTASLATIRSSNT